MLTNILKETLFKPKSRNSSWDWYFFLIKTKEKHRGLFIGIRWGPKLRKASHKAGGQHFSEIGFNTSMKEATRRRSSIARIPKNILLYTRAIQVHTGGNLIALELTRHVAIPHKRKEFLFHRGCSHVVTSVFRSGRIAGDEKAKEDRPSSSHLSAHPGTIQMKKNPAMTSQSR